MGEQRSPIRRAVTRRQLFGLVGAGTVALAVSACSEGGLSAPSEPWSPRMPLRIPDLLQPADGRFDLELQRGTTEILAGTTTDTWGVNGAFLGPTLRMRRGQDVAMRVTNRLGETTTVHWHGMHVPAVYDGGPHQPIEPDATWEPAWTVENRASTLWYHPHLHGATATHVFNGVAGLIIVDDEEQGAIGLPGEYGVDDVPCILMDRTIEPDGSMPFTADPGYGQMGPEVLVNGTLGAYFEASRTTVRFRFLNGSNARRYHLGFADGREFTMIAGDQGLLPEPLRLASVSIGPAERAEIVVSFEPGEQVRLISAAGDDAIDPGELTVLEVRVAADASAGTAVAPESLAFSGPAPFEAPVDATVREFRLDGHNAINGLESDMTRIDAVVAAGALEIWEVRNDMFSHNFHIHGCEFTILERDGGPPEPWERGRKDTVHLRQPAHVRLAVQFDAHVDPATPYMFHCHILRHEDLGMMGQFVVVEPGTEATTPTTIDGPHGGH